MSKILLSTPSFNGNEWKYVKECLDTEWVSSAGKYVDLFEERVADYTKSKFAIACVNGTSALQLSLRLAGVNPGDEVIVPSLTFIAPINSIAYNGASPIFMDSDSYYNIDFEKTISFIKTNTFFKSGKTYNKLTKKRISALIPVHVWGNACWLDELLSICQERNISIVEDASESMGTFYKKGRYKSKHTGTLGLLGCISFNGNKIITSGGGGMILTNSQKLYERAKYLTTQAKDDPTRYIHNDIGYNFRLTNIQAALGVSQLETLNEILDKKKYIFDCYRILLKNIKGLGLSNVPTYSKNNHWLNILKIDKKSFKRDIIMDKLEKNSIQTRPVWYLNHLQIPYKNYQSYKIEKANDLVENSLCMPSSSNLSIKDIEKIVGILNG